jgi:hypothetical protein
VTLQGVTTRDKAKEADKNIFDVIDLQSAIDPLGEEGGKSK